jgi:tRNA A37 threonylcarbamoyladenosine synthetase subunit TsaC/SUA5/YrdC
MVMKQLGDRLGLILDGGETKSAKPSTIVELHGDEWRILREGAITAAEIEEALR